MGVLTLRLRLPTVLESDHFLRVSKAIDFCAKKNRDGTCIKRQPLCISPASLPLLCPSPSLYHTAMRSFTTLSFWSLLALAGLVSLTSAAPAVEDCSKSELGCLIAGRSVLPSPTIDERDLWTNAERLSRGLPPKSPSRRGEFLAYS